MGTMIHKWGLGVTRRVLRDPWWGNKALTWHPSYLFGVPGFPMLGPGIPSSGPAFPTLDGVQGLPGGHKQEIFSSNDKLGPKCPNHLATPFLLVEYDVIYG